VRFAHQVSAVEQQPQAGYIRLVGELAVRPHDRILPAVDGLHS